MAPFGSILNTVCIFRFCLCCLFFKMVCLRGCIRCQRAADSRPCKKHRQSGVGADIIRPDQVRQRRAANSRPSFHRKYAGIDTVPLIRHGCAMPPSPRGRLFVSYPRSRYRGGYYPPEIPPLGLPIPFVPSGHFPLTRGIGLAMTGFLTALAPPVGELARRQP